jgi:curved DNA-binding protein
MDFKDYYKVLGVERSATDEEVKKSYRKLARKHHPDLSKAADSQARMQDINEAYEVLRDLERRAAYDRVASGWQGGQEFRPPPGWDAGFEFSGAPPGATGSEHFSEFFESLFGAAGRAARATRMPAATPASRRRPSRPDRDLAGGCVQRCRAHADAAKPELGRDGASRLHERQLSVNIPKGVRAGQQIRLAGQGSAGLGGGPAGDLYLEVQFEPHPRYRVDGRDLYLSLPVTPWEAALGAAVRLPTLSGTLEVSVPAGSQTGRRLRLKGRGIPAAVPGDLYVVLEVVLPEASSAKAQDLYLG